MTKDDFKQLYTLFHANRLNFPVDDLDYRTFYGALSFQTKLAKRIFSLRGNNAYNISITFEEFEAFKCIMQYQLFDNELQKIICYEFIELGKKEVERLENIMYSKFYPSIIDPKHI